MVLRCKGFSQERHDSALKGLAPAPDEVDSLVNSVKIKNPSKKNVSKSEGEKASSKMKSSQMVNFILIIHNYSYVNGVELFVTQIDGVESVKGDRDSIRLEVKGKVDPFKIREMVEHKTKQKVELVFPLAEMVVDRDENKDTEAKLKNQIQTVHRNEIANEKTKEGLLVLKIKLCCDSCNQKLQKILKNKGLETVTMDVQKDLVTVKGTVDMTELRSYIKHELKKEIEIIVPAEAMIPGKKDDKAHYEKEKYAEDVNKKGKDTRAAHKADKSNTVDEKYRGTATVHKKHIATATVDQKYKATDKVSANKGTNKADEKYKGNTVNEKYKVTTAVYETDKGRAVLGQKDQGIAIIDEKDKGNATKDDKDKENDKDGLTNNELGRDSGGEMKYNASDGGGGERGKIKDVVGNKEEYFGATVKRNPMNYMYDDNAYSYWHEGQTVKYSNGLDQLFSDENPHSCSVM